MWDWLMCYLWTAWTCSPDQTSVFPGLSDPLLVQGRQQTPRWFCWSERFYLWHPPWLVLDAEGNSLYYNTVYKTDNSYLRGYWPNFAECFVVLKWLPSQTSFQYYVCALCLNEALCSPVKCLTSLVTLFCTCRCPFIPLPLQLPYLHLQYWT